MGVYTALVEDKLAQFTDICSISNIRLYLITLNYIELHGITLNCIKLHYIKLH